MTVPGGRALEQLDPEGAARQHLERAFASTDLPDFVNHDVDGQMAEFRCLGTDLDPLTQTRTVLFRQHYRKIPVYGSLVTMELDEQNRLLAINAALGEPQGVDPVARRSPAQAMETVRAAAGYGEQRLDAIPRLYYYFDPAKDRWLLAYIVENVVKVPSAAGRRPASPRAVADYVVDAHTGALVVEVPRSPTLQPVEEKALDSLGALRTITCELQPDGVKRLRDPTHNVHTYDFGFRDVGTSRPALPGADVLNPPHPWRPGAVSAHANAVRVAKFLRDVLKREGLDNRGGAIVSSINCVYDPDFMSPYTWLNAMWDSARKQMVFGQEVVGGEPRSLAKALDVVAHELCHGLIDYTAGLQTAGIPGALNESYADIFGIIVSNFDEPDLRGWNWELGEALEGMGMPVRNFARPSAHGQAEHMEQYVPIPPPWNEDNDFGGVHTYSGIHNLAAYKILTAGGTNRSRLFDAASVARLFYLALTKHLSRTSTFGDSRRGVELAARTLFRTDPGRDAKLAAVAAAFDAVGIV